MLNPDDTAALLVARQDTVDRLEALEDAEAVDRRREVYWWAAAVAAVSLGVLASQAFVLAALYPASWLWGRARRRRTRRAETRELRERLESLG